MDIQFKDGAIVVKDKYLAKTAYDVSNNKITAQFDGRGAVTRYAVINKYSIFTLAASLYAIDGEQIDWSIPKRVEMIGKRQIVEYSTEKADFKLTQFLDDNSNAIYSRMEVTAKADLEYRNVITHDVDFGSYVKELFTSRLRFGNIPKLMWGAATGK